MVTQFTIQGLETESDILGLWQAAPQPVSIAYSISSEVTVGGEGNNLSSIVWSVSLPSDSVEAEQTLQKQAYVLGSTQRAITASGKFLERLSPSQAMVSFSANKIDQLPNPEARLMVNLTHLQGDVAATTYSLGLTSRLPGFPESWQETITAYQQFVQQIFQLLAPTVRVETKIESVLLAYTLVRLTGDFETIWTEQDSAKSGSAGDEEKQKMHRRILSLTVESRLALLQLLAQTSASAAALAAKFSIPGGAVVALPAAWRYIQDVIKQAQRLAVIKKLQGLP